MHTEVLTRCIETGPRVRLTVCTQALIWWREQTTDLTTFCHSVGWGVWWLYRGACPAPYSGCTPQPTAGPVRAQPLQCKQDSASSWDSWDGEIDKQWDPTKKERHKLATRPNTQKHKPSHRWAQVWLPCAGLDSDHPTFHRCPPSSSHSHQGQLPRALTSLQFSSQNRKEGSLQVHGHHKSTQEDGDRVRASLI